MVKCEKKNILCIHFAQTNATEREILSMEQLYTNSILFIAIRPNFVVLPLQIPNQSSGWGLIVTTVRKSITEIYTRFELLSLFHLIV